MSVLSAHIQLVCLKTRRFGSPPSSPQGHSRPPAHLLGGCFFVEGDPPKSKIKGSLYTTPHSSSYTGPWGQDGHQALTSLRRSPGPPGKSLMSSP